jgi:hypothetical protein
MNGGDNKYGRLYTEADVRMLMRAAVAETSGIVWGSADAAEAIERLEKLWNPTFPSDEPLFVLRAQDRLARAAILKYWDSTPAYINGKRDQGLRAATDAFEAFATKNLERMKDPD